MTRASLKGVAVSCIRGAALAAAIVLAGCSGGGGDSAPPEMPSGVVDSGYGAGGKVMFGLGEGMFASAVDSSGNAYVAGDSVVKVDRSGNRVAGYGGPATPREFAPLIDDAGNLFMASLDGAVVKRDAAGHVDASFGNAGRAQVAPWGGFTSQIVDLHRDAAGNLIVVGLAQGPHYSFDSVALAKLDATGQLVSSFGSGGKKITSVNLHPFSSWLASARDAGGLVVAGHDAFDRVIVAKLDANGELVAGFGQGGTWIAPSCGAAGPVALGTTLAGDLYVGGSCEGAATVFKIDGSGTLIGGFGSAGRASGFFPDVGSVGGLLPAPDGSLYVAGTFLVPTPPALGTCPRPVVAKLDPTGIRDTRFGTGGVVQPVASAGSFRNMLARDASGLVYVGTLGSQCPLFDPVVPYTIVRLSP